MPDGRTGRPVNKLNERASAGWDNFVVKRIAGEFSDGPNIALKISWRTESESGNVWTGKFYLNTLRVDVEIFESAKKYYVRQKLDRLCRT